MADRSTYNAVRREIAKQARSDGFDQIADWLEMLADRPIPAESGERWEADGNYRIVLPSQQDYPQTPIPVATFIYRRERDRAVASVNALAGIEDPEAAVKAARSALKALAVLEIPKRPQGNAGAYSIRHSDIEAAREALALLGAPKP